MSELDSISAAALAPDVRIAGDRPEAEIIDRDVRTTPREMTVARFIYDTFLRNERFAVEKGFHNQMRESWRICHSEPDAREKAKLAKLNLPTDVADSTTEVRRFAALSQLKEIFASSGQFPCKLKSTSSPDVPEFITAQLLQKMLDELMAVIAQSGAVPSDEDVANFGRDRMAELLNAVKEKANDEIELLERRVRDDFEEADFLDAFNLGMEYFTTYGTAIWEGPTPCIRWKNEYGGADGMKISRKAQASVTFRAVNPLDVYPSPDQTNVEDGPVCIKVRVSPQELWLNAKEAKGASAEKDGVWFKDTVADLLAKYPAGGVKLSWQDGEDENRRLRGQSCWTADASCMMEGISYYGQLKGSLLVRMGVKKTHDGTKIDEDDYYEVNAIVIDDYCVYCRIINPCMGRPLSKVHFYDSPDNFFGVSIAQRLVPYQRIINACLPAIIVNMRMTCAPIFWVNDVSRLLDKTPAALQMYGGKVVTFKPQTIGGVAVQSGPPMGSLRVDSQVNDIIGVMKNILQRVEDVSGIPSYTYGQNVTGGAGRTYSGLAMLTEAANRVMKMIIDGLDRGAIRRMVKMTAYRRMLYDDGIAYTGDVEVIPTGVMGLILKQQELQKVLQLMQMVVGNQVLTQTIGARGLMELFRQVLETYDIANIDKIIPPKADLDLQEFVALVQRNAGMAGGQQQAAQGGGEQTGALPPSQPQAQERQDTYMREGTGYKTPMEANPGSANERRGAA